MADPSADHPSRGKVPDRRKLVDLVRVERGEPERRRQHRFGDPTVTGDDTEGPERPDGEDGPS